MTDTILRDLPIHWRGVDSQTPEGCELFVTEVLGLPTTYILRDGVILGRIESAGIRLSGYVGGSLKGGEFIGGQGGFYETALRIVAAHRDA